MGLLDRFEDAADRVFGNPAEQAVASRIVTNEVVGGVGKKDYRDLGEPEAGADRHLDRSGERIAESFHNRAIESGLESELTYYERGGVDVRVREPGDTSISFLADAASEQQIEEVLARQKAAAHHAQAFVYGKEGCSDQVTALIGRLAETEEFLIREVTGNSPHFEGEAAFEVTQPGIRRSSKISKATKAALNEIDPAWESFAELL